MEEIIKKGAKIGKADKQRQQWLKRYESTKVNIDPKSELEKIIKSSNDDITKIAATRENIEIDDAFNKYVNARNNRHDVWVELLEDCKNNPMYNFGDRKVSTFCMELREQEGINIDDPPRDIAKKTPDIAVFAREQGVIYIGDVAVARTVEMREQSKTTKYQPIVRWFKAQQMTVVQVNLVIDENLSNLNNVIRNLEDYQLITVSSGRLKRAVHYHTTCHNDMSRIKDLCTLPNELLRMIQDHDGYKEPEKIGIPESGRRFGHIEPTLSEEIIIEWVKEETDKRMAEQYYDKDVKESVSEFDKILNTDEKDRVIKPPKSTLLSCENAYEVEQKTSHDLILDYINDIGSIESSRHAEYVLDLLPDRQQLNIMKKAYNENRKAKDIEKKVFGPFQYSRTSRSSNRLTMDLNAKLTLGKKVRNEKKEPTTLDRQMYPKFIDDVEKNMLRLGSKSNKKSFLKDEWASANKFELDNTEKTKDIYDYCRNTVGAQMAHTFGNLYQRITHLKTSESSRDNVYVPPNGAFVVVMPKEHAPVTSASCDMPAIFIARYSKENIDKTTCEYEHTFDTKKYRYYISKLCRFNIDKISNWDQAGYTLVATSTYLMSQNPKLYEVKEKIVGLMTYLILDIHQKTSEYLDLLKYISFMPFAQVHRLSKLVGEKMNLLKKTKLDIWMINRMRDFVVELSDIDKIKAVKPVISLSNAKMTRESLGLKMKLPSFIDLNTRHDNVKQFVEEINTLFISRPKQLYGSQFMDKSITSTAEWNKEYEEEVDRYYDWVTTGEQSSCCIRYPFDAKFAFCRDAIIYAQKYFQDRIEVDIRQVEKNLSKEKYINYMHSTCSLRGCTKDKSRRKNKADIHTTSMEECLYRYKHDNYSEEKSKITSIALEFLNSGEPMEFSMSEKNQRGSGRPIATPTLGAKAALITIEKPESALGKCVPNNIIVSDKNKLKEMSEAYKDLVADAAISGYKKVYQLTEDQSKFSENDNIRKYYCYISNNYLLPLDVRRLQMKALDGLANREHLVKRMPRKIIDDPSLKKYVNQDQNGIRAIIGWPQGMLNMISTSIHSIADYWITYAYNKAYPNNKVKTKGLVHSDDSWVTVACDSEEDFVRFSVFRAAAKKLFCLKLNDKKLWGSKYLGELVSNYNVNGDVHLSVTKTVTNSFNSLMYQNWVIDVNSQISSLQQAYRNGATLDILILMYTILSQQILTSYQVKGKQYELLHLLPIELGGYPDKPVFSIAVTGSHSHYQSLLQEYSNKENHNEDFMRIVTKAMTLSAMQNQGVKIDRVGKFYKLVEGSKKYQTDILDINEEGKVTAYIVEEDEYEEVDVVEKANTSSVDDMDLMYVRKVKRVVKRPLNDNDFESLRVTGRGDVFTCIKHIMPKSKKITLTVNRLNDIPFVGEGLGLLVTKPRTIEDALGALKDQTSTMLYQLASEHYSQSSRRLAISQAIQSSGKTVRVGDLKPMTMNEMLDFLEKCTVIGNNPDNLKAAFYDDSSVSEICNNIVSYSEYDSMSADKRKIINVMPKVESRYKTASRLDEVLFYIIDNKLGTNYYSKYTKQEATRESLHEDADLILRRFDSYFSYYKPKYAAALIMSEYMGVKRSKIWMQPYLRNETPETFLCDLYGKTISKETNYKVKMIYTLGQKVTLASKLINTMYTVSILNNIYPGKFEMESVCGFEPVKIITDTDPMDLTEDDNAKMAVVHYKLTDSTWRIRAVEKEKRYMQHYYKSQIYENGRYRGHFKVSVKYCNAVIEIEGEPGRLSLVSNTTDTHMITQAMMEFTNRNFVMYKYDHPSQWANSDLWYNRDIIRSDLYLSHYCSSASLINSRPSTNSIPIRVDKNLKYHLNPIIHQKYAYEVDDTLRTVTKIIDEERYRVFNISQDFQCPLADKVRLKPAFIDGFENEELLQSGVIVSICTRKYYNISSEIYRRLLVEKKTPVSPTALVDFYTRIVGKLNGDKVKVDSESVDMEYETIDVDPVNITDIIETMETTSPEDLQCINVDAIYDEDASVSKKLVASTNLTRIMCRILYGNKTDNDISNFISIFGSSRPIREIIHSHKDEDYETYNEEIETWSDASIALSDEIEHDLRCFLVGNDMDRNERFEEIDVRRALNNRPDYTSNRMINYMADRAITRFMHFYLELDRDDMYQELQF